ncbi:TetR/AcrR family transcriptional regulator [Rhodococcus maanshanensis]|uniref:DNA-binding transcriptional regulator, AcrR family n=1 Tax=Rhodococcus maanshanensis TaxID=183556 RepID=A0A1H7Q9G9_9NOCA|nr:TetR/AcrR family transcriptional regulator [Rhodococcus maanshanensis]SEL44449.1 DNA-binding transcriptional regulator, AcrR family [Rhodococcus maanshanensis]
MPNVKVSRREQYAESTRRALLDAGLALFVERGFGAVSAEELAATSGVTRGALYHHFDGKQGLFEALFEEQEERAARRVGAAMAAHEDPWDRQSAGLDEFLAVCAEPDYREIVLLQGPVALGWDRWRELDQRYLRGLVLDDVRALREAGVIRPHPDELVAAAVFGAITEISLAAVRAPDPVLAREEAARVILELLSGLRA